MTRPPSGEWPTGPAQPDDTPSENLLSAEALRAIATELTRNVRPTPASLRDWVVATADAERTRPSVGRHPSESNGRIPTSPNPTDRHRSATRTSDQEEDAMSARNPTAARLTTLPRPTRPAAPLRPIVSTRRRGTFAQRWNRHGWPIVELVGAAVLIIGLVSVMMGGNGGSGLPSLLPSYGNVQEVTPTVDPDAVAMAQGNAGRTGEMPGPGVVSDPELLWRLPVTVANGETPWGPTGSDVDVVASDGVTVFVERQTAQPGATASALVQATLHVVDSQTGSERWATSFNGVFQGQPLLADGLIVIAVDLFETTSAADGPAAAARSDETAKPGLVLAFDASTGAEHWRTSLGPVGTQDPMFANDTIYLIDRSGNPSGLDVETGSIIWTGANIPPVGDAFTPYGVTFSSVAIAGGHLIVTSASGFTYAYDLDDDSPAWVWPEPAMIDPNGVVTSDILGIGPVASDGRVYLLTADTPVSSSLVAVDLLSGVEVWRQSLGERQFRPGLIAVADGVVLDVAGTYPGSTIQAFSADQGAPLWSVSSARPVDQEPTIADGVAYVSAGDGTVTAYRLQDGQQVWQVRTGDAIASSVYTSEGVAYFASHDQHLYAIGGSRDVASSPSMTGQEAAVDISGLPACNAIPRPVGPVQPSPEDSETSVVSSPDATPRLTLPGLAYGEEGSSQAPAISWSELPPGTSPSAGQANGISRMLTRLHACDRPGGGAYVASFYSDDFFLRPANASNLTDNGYEDFSAATHVTSPAEVIAYGRVLPDGRVALVEYSETQAGSASVTVLAVQANGDWLIDEVADVSVTGQPLQG